MSEFPQSGFKVRNAAPHELSAVGRLMVDVYSSLEGFPKPAEQPAYYKMLANVGELLKKPGTEILVAASGEDEVAGAVVYFADMQHYGSGGTATREKSAAGFRLLAVAHAARGRGVGKMLTLACISKARAQRQKQVILHTTLAMKNAWEMYERLGFKRSEDLDFSQGGLDVFGFRLML